MTLEKFLEAGAKRSSSPPVSRELLRLKTIELPARAASLRLKLVQHAARCVHERSCSHGQPTDQDRQARAH
jgi:hypothetical protein